MQQTNKQALFFILHTKRKNGITVSLLPFSFSPQNKKTVRSSVFFLFYSENGFTAQYFLSVENRTLMPSGTACQNKGLALQNKTLALGNPKPNPNPNPLTLTPYLKDRTFIQTIKKQKTKEPTVSLCFVLCTKCKRENVLVF